MLTVALQTIRGRWATFAGTFVALVLGVAQVAATLLLLFAGFDQPDRPPQRFADAAAVVWPTDPEWKPVRHDLHVRPLQEARGMSAALVGRLRALGPVDLDRDFDAQVAGGPDGGVGHPWPLARYGGHRLVEGRAPVADTEVVLGQGSRVAVGRPVTVYTADGPRRYTVTGLTRDVGYEHPIFFTPAEAERLSPRVAAAVVPAASVADLERVVGADARVLTGQDRHLIDASRGQDLEDIDNTVTLLPVMASVAGLTAVFVVASTFAFAVIQRWREIALLRLVGATPRQVRRMVYGEAVLVGLTASLTGCVAGRVGADALAGWLHRLDVAPAWFGVHGFGPWVWLPLCAAFASGVLVSVLGVAVAARRAGRVRPAEALREAAADDTAGVGGRQLLGLAGLVVAIGVGGYVGFVDPGITLSPNNYVPLLLLPVMAFAVLAPVVVAPLTRLLTAPFSRARAAGPMLVRESALTARRRTAATAAPVLLTVGIATSLLGATASVAEARDAGIRGQITADYTIVPAGAPGISTAVVDRIEREVPGVDVVAPVRSIVYTRDEDRWEENDAQVVYGGDLDSVMTLPITEGAATGLRKDTVILPKVWGFDLGDRVPITMGDGTTAPLTVIGLYQALRGQDIAYLSPDHLASTRYSANGMARRAYVDLLPGADRSAVTAALTREGAAAGLSVIASNTFEVTEAATARQLTAVRQRSVAVIVVLFCFVAILNTLLMSSADRRRDLAVLRMSGASPRQVITVFAGESMLVGVIGVALAVGASALNLFGLRFALAELFGNGAIHVPWTAVLAIAGVAVALAVVGAVLPALAVVRAPAGALAGRSE